MKNEKNSKHTVVLIIGIVLFLALMMAQSRISAMTSQKIAQAAASGSTVPNTGIMGSINGVIAQIQVLISSFLVIYCKKGGYIAASVLNFTNAAYTLIFAVIIAGSVASVPGIVVPIISVVTITIIYVYSLKISKTNSELMETNRTLTETNRVMREKDEKLTYLAYYDVLTGLANRQLFIDHMDEMIEEDKNTPFSVIFFDIDDFKKINDSYGHNTGDIMLTTYADRLKLFCGKSNFVGKLGGDEFAVIVKGNMNEASIVNYIERLRAAVCEPVQANGVVLQTTMSFGVAVYPNDGINSEDILKSTDIAVFNAKANGKDRTCFYSQQQFTQRR